MRKVLGLAGAKLNGSPDAVKTPQLDRSSVKFVRHGTGSRLVDPTPLPAY
jgi:hypothetical protein